MDASGSPASPVGASFSSGPACIAELAYRSGPAFIAGAGFSKLAEFLGAPDLLGCETRPDIRRAISAAYNRLHITPRGSSLHDANKWYVRQQLPPEWKR